MKILYVALKHDYGDAARGLSFEHFNFFESLLEMGHDILYFDSGSGLRHSDRARANRRLREVVDAEHPDLMFTVLFRGELDPTTVESISQDTSTTTLNWFCDDHWRFESFSQAWAPRFNSVVTTARTALPKYAMLGYKNVIKSQWACNHRAYHPVDAPAIYDVSFVGLPHGDRRHVVDMVRSAGIDIRVWGHGWPAGRVNQSNMIRIFNQSRINLNLANSVQANSFAQRVVGLLLRQLAASPLSLAERQWLALRLLRMEQSLTGHDLPRYREQIKGRNFEIPGCGGFLLTGSADNLEEYYAEDCEVACFADPEGLLRQLRRYLADAAERQRVADAGYRRTLAEHTYFHRFAAIFQHLQLPSPSLSALLDGSVAIGSVEEVSV